MVTKSASVFCQLSALIRLAKGPSRFALDLEAWVVLALSEVLFLKPSTLLSFSVYEANNAVNETHIRMHMHTHTGVNRPK